MQIKIVPICVCVWFSFGVFAQAQTLDADGTPHLFETSDRCIACHSRLSTADGRDVSIGYWWRSSMMANSARDPYWQAGVRREVMDHPEAQAAIEDKCSTCHMPMERATAVTQGGTGHVFANLPGAVNAATSATAAEAIAIGPAPAHPVLAADGVSCTVCHQIRPDNFGREESFTGGFEIDRTAPAGSRALYGPHLVDGGRQHLMNSAGNVVPSEALHMARSELCATCHTLYTESLDDDGNEVGRLPEQVPYLEWRHSEYRATRSCQDCHMPVVEEDTAISSVLGQPRPGLSQHVFRGGNAFMLGVLGRHHDELGVAALPQELAATATRTRDFLGTETARVEVIAARRSGTSLEFDIAVESLSGHKLPTAYPSRRAWLHVSVTDASGRIVFESGAVRADGSIVGNDNDADGSRYEPHYTTLTAPDQVQIYEPILADSHDRVTTGLLFGVRYAKDNRLLPRGFDKATADPDVGVYGAARDDADFEGGGDRVRYRVELPRAGEVTIAVELLYQSIGYRWAENLKAYRATETDRFVSYFAESAGASAIPLAHATRRTD